MSLHIDVAFAEVGKAVWLGQILEATLVPIFEFFRMRTEDGYMQKTQGFVQPGAYRQPLRNLIKHLAAQEHISPEVEAALDRYIEDRHRLVHRWILEHGRADQHDIAAWVAMAEHARSVGEQAQFLTRSFSAYMVKYADPDWAAANPEEYDQRMRDLFRQRNDETDHR